jgi:hypothetical protein
MKNKKKYFYPLKNNSGDAYIAFLILFMAILLIFSGIFTVMKITAITKEVYAQIENSTDSVVSEIKIDSYQTLIDGTTKQSNMLFNDTDFINALNERLKGTVISKHLKKYDNDNALVYDIYNISVQYDQNGTVYISFDIDIPINYNGRLLMIDTESYTKSAVIHFKN